MTAPPSAQHYLANPGAPLLSHPSLPSYCLLQRWDVCRCNAMPLLHTPPAPARRRPRRRTEYLHVVLQRSTRTYRLSTRHTPAPSSRRPLGSGPLAPSPLAPPLCAPRPSHSGAVSVLALGLYRPFCVVIGPSSGLKRRFDHFCLFTTYFLVPPPFPLLSIYRGRSIILHLSSVFFDLPF